MTETKPGTGGMGAIAKFFGAKAGGLKAFAAEWKELSDTDKQQIREGIENGSLTY